MCKAIFLPQDARADETFDVTEDTGTPAAGGLFREDAVSIYGLRSRVVVANTSRWNNVPHFSCR